MPELSKELASELADLEDALSVPQVADQLRVHKTTVYRLIKTGRLQAISVSGGTKRRAGLRVPQRAFVAYLRGPHVVAGEAAAS